MTIEAKEQVAAFHDYLEHEYGVTPEMARKMVQTLIKMVEKERRFERYGEWAAKAIIVAIVTGLSTGIWLTMKALWAYAHGGHG